MSAKILTLGSTWLAERVGELTEEIIRVSPSQFTEENRYLPGSVTSMPGPMSLDVNPFMREILNCFDVDSPVREVNLMKGVQITYTTILESGLLYYIAHVKTLPMMYMTADGELASARIENNIIPMLNQSGFGDLIRSSDEGNLRKTGKTKNHLQFGADCYLVPFGAKNANKMRSYSICILIKDELDGWPDIVGKDGDPDSLSDARTKGYEDQKKIFRGSTPGEYPSKIEKQYLRGDQRKYMVRCLKCGFPQELRWSGTNDRGEEYGIFWNVENNIVVPDSVRYLCQECQHPHQEHDKTRLLSLDEGAEWMPTATPINPHVRSYHLPAMYSPVGMGSWYEQVIQYLKAWDPEKQKMRDIGEFQVFYNNVLAKPFQVYGTKVSFQAASAHRRTWYNLGTIPNRRAKQYSGGQILFLTCTVDVHKHFIAVAIIGWCRDARCYLIDYQRLEDDSETGCESPESPVWGKLQKIIEEDEYSADDGKAYKVQLTLIDSGYATSTVYNFCSEYAAGVLPIKGVPTVGRQQRPRAFWEFKTQTGAIGFNILVDHYKDRLAPVLRREWDEHQGIQDKYHFNAPVDVTDKQLKELTVERKQDKTDERGRTTHEWYRPGNARNELWDLLVYAHAAVEMYAFEICTIEGMEQVDWAWFWDAMSA
jgi:phage terminase large subunit GpA-like protein